MVMNEIRRMNLINGFLIQMHLSNNEKRRIILIRPASATTHNEFVSLSCFLRLTRHLRLLDNREKSTYFIRENILFERKMSQVAIQCKALKLILATFRVIFFGENKSEISGGHFARS